MNSYSAFFVLIFTILTVVILMVTVNVEIHNKVPVQTKYQHNETKSNGRGNIINEDGECKMWGSENRIDGGMHAELGEVPSIALLEYLLDGVYSFDCTGSLINHRYVITAAQCLYNKHLINVRLGEYDTAKHLDCDEDDECQPEPINVGIEEVTIHSEFSQTDRTNDIGLVRLSMDVPYIDYFIKPICIPDQTINTGVGEVAKVAGWGTDSNGQYTPIMRSVWIKIIDWQRCYAIYKPYHPIYLSQLCAGGERNRNACFGDLGGPLLTRYNRRTYLEGIVSLSAGCKRNGLPDVYTKVNYFYDWILKNLKP